MGLENNWSNRLWKKHRAKMASSFLEASLRSDSLFDDFLSASRHSRFGAGRGAGPSSIGEDPKAEAAAGEGRTSF
jgi:hypothetical protein